MPGFQLKTADFERFKNVSILKTEVVETAGFVRGKNRTRIDF
jgi:hypothetical protein